MTMAANTERVAKVVTYYHDSDVLQTTFCLYGSLIGVILILFCVIRHVFPRPYNVRSWAKPKIRTPLASDMHGWINWMWKIFQYSDDQILNECGMDALCYTRILFMGAKLSLVGIFNAIWLMPLYAGAEDSTLIVDRVVRITVTNVPSGSNRWIGTVLAAYLIFGSAMLLVLWEFKWFTRMRHKFLRKPLPRNYTVFVRNIPKRFRNNTALAEFFRGTFSSVNVLEARIGIHANDLASVVSRRKTTVANLEHAIALYEKTNRRPTHRKGCLHGKKVDSIETYREQLVILNDDVSERIATLQKIANGSADNQQCDDDANSSPKIPTVDFQNESRALLDGSANKTVYVDSDSSGDDESETLEGESRPFGLKKLSSVIRPEDGQVLSGGFVSFAKLSTTFAAMQTIQYAEPFSMIIMDAPNPNEVFWFNVARTNSDLQLGNLLSKSCTVALCIFWTIPMSFIASLSSVDGLRQAIPFIDDLITKAPFLDPLFAQLAPLLVVMVNALLPTLLGYISAFEGPISAAVVETSKFMKLSAFNVGQTFFVSALSGSVVQEISNIIDRPKEIIDLLANSLPTQATYFMQITFIGTVTLSASELLRVTPMMMACLRSFIGPRLTEKERRAPFCGLYPLCEPFPFEHAYFAADTVLNFMILLVYAVISPLTCFVTGFCFLFKAAMSRHHFIYVYPSTRDSGGKLWLGFIRVLLVCLLIAEFTVVGLLALKQANFASSLFFPLVVATVLFIFYIHQRHFLVARHLPTREALKEDRKRGPDFAKKLVIGAYLQPELAVEKTVVVDNFGMK